MTKREYSITLVRNYRKHIFIKGEFYKTKYFERRYDKGRIIMNISQVESLFEKQIKFPMIKLGGKAVKIIGYTSFNFQKQYEIKIKEVDSLGKWLIFGDPERG